MIERVAEVEAERDTDIESGTGTEKLRQQLTGVQVDTKEIFAEIDNDGDSLTPCICVSHSLHCVSHSMHSCVWLSHCVWLCR